MLQSVELLHIVLNSLKKKVYKNQVYNHICIYMYVTVLGNYSIILYIEKYYLVFYIKLMYVT